MDYDSYQHIAVTRDGRRLNVTLNRPEVKNAVNSRLHYELGRIWDDVMYDDDADVVVLTGAGDAFCAGGDIPWLKREFAKKHISPTMVYEAKKLVFSLLDFEKPVICRLNGDAIGLGATVALFCDTVIAVDTARLADPHVRVGLVAGDGGAIIWPHLIGHANAKRYLMTGDMIAAPEAVKLGLIAEALPAAELDAAVDKLVNKLLAGAQQAIRWSKLSVNIGLKHIATQIFDASMGLELITKLQPDHGEAVDAFLEKRKPKFGG